MEVGTVARVDGMEAVKGLRLRAFEDSSMLIEHPEELRKRAARDGFLFVRGLVPTEIVLAMRRCVLEYASAIGWLDATAPCSEARAAPGKRIGFFQDPDWVGLQVHVQNRPEMWALGDAVAIHRALQLVDNRSSYLFLSTANTCRVFSPHPDLVTQPHQDAHYVRMIADFWTAWIPLDDCPRALGPIALAAGSHVDGLREHSGEGIVDGGATPPDDVVWSTTDFQCGDVVLFRSLTLHRSLPNRSGDRLRLSADFRYGFWDESATVDWRAGALANQSE